MRLIYSKLTDAQKSYEVFPRGVCYILNTGTGTSLKIYEKAREVQYTILKTNHIQLCYRARSHQQKMQIQHLTLLVYHK